MVCISLDLRVKALELTQRVERDMAAIPQKMGKIGLRISRTVSMGQALHFFEGQPGFVDGTGCGLPDVFPDDGKGLPVGEGLERQDDVDARLIFDSADQRKVAAQ